MFERYFILPKGGMWIGGFFLHIERVAAGAVRHHRFMKNI